MMQPKHKYFERTKVIILDQGILPLYFHNEVSICFGVLHALYRAGIKAVEYTDRGEKAYNNFKAMIALRDAGMPDMLLGVGTVKNMTQASLYLQAGADFIVSPGFVPEVAVYCVQNDIFYAPGCMTPTEIIAAETVGIRFIKLFPGNVLGPEFMITIKDIFPKLSFMATGGVDTTMENLKLWFDAGVSAVGLGSKLISKQLMETKDFNTIESDAKKVLKIISTLKK